MIAFDDLAYLTENDRGVFHTLLVSITPAMPQLVSRQIY